jgi:hypothetical protein
VYYVSQKHCLKQRTAKYFRQKYTAYISVSQSVVCGGSPDDLRQFAGGFGRKSIAKIVSDT